MYKLFVYGSLMFDEVWDQLLKGQFKKSSAILYGYKRVQVLNESYPGIQEEENSKVEGILVEGLTEDHISLLDNFEGDYYERKSVSVSQAQGSIKCDVYVFREKYRHLLSRSLWCEKTFQVKHLKEFLSKYTS